MSLVPGSGTSGSRVPDVRGGARHAQARASAVRADAWTWGRPSISGKLAAMQEETGQPPLQATPEQEPPARVRVAPAVREMGGPQGPEPTRYGDWEKAGRCIDF